MITLEKTGDNWLLKIGENEYISHISSKNDVEVVNSISDKSKWSVSIEEEIVKFYNFADETRYIQYYSQSTKFAAYSSKQKSIPSLYAHSLNCANSVPMKVNFFPG